MKSILAFALLCLALTNAFNIFQVSDSDVQTLLNAQDTDSTVSNFNEVSALQDFLTGLLSSAAGVTASDSLLCLKGDGPIALFEYYYGLALAAGTSGQSSAAESARQYLTTIGARHLSQLPADFVQCLSSSQDFQAVQTKWNVSLSSDKFSAAFSAMAGKNPVYFQSLFNSVYNAMTQGNFKLAGHLYGGYARAAGFRAGRN